MYRGMRALLTVTAMTAVVAGCSSSSSPQTSTARHGMGAPPTEVADAAQAYVDDVNQLCDELLPKIIKVTHGGSIDVPVAKYLASWPAHSRLLHQFDTQVGLLREPPSAKRKAAVLAIYSRFADRLDNARLVAANQGQAAYDQEVHSEANVENAPAIKKLLAAGFNQSCTAR